MTVDDGDVVVVSGLLVVVVVASLALVVESLVLVAGSLMVEKVSLVVVIEDVVIVVSINVLPVTGSRAKLPEILSAVFHEVASIGTHVITDVRPQQYITPLSSGPSSTMLQSELSSHISIHCDIVTSVPRMNEVPGPSPAPSLTVSHLTCQLSPFRSTIMVSSQTAVVVAIADVVVLSDNVVMLVVEVVVMVVLAVVVEADASLLGRYQP